jgi:hypothetical protein
MDKSYVTFIKNLIIFTLILALAGYFLNYFVPPQYLSQTVPFLYVFFFSATLLVHHMLRKLSVKKDSSFIRMFMLLTFGKLLFFLFIIIFYSLLFRADAVAFIIDFFLLYMLFTIFEVNQSLKVVKSKNKMN